MNTNQNINWQNNNQKRNSIGAFAQWREFVIEYFQMIMGDVKNLVISLMFPLLAAVIVVWIAGEYMFVDFEGTKAGNFILVSASIWGGLFNSIQVIVKDRKNIKRNYVAGARLSCYTLSRTFLQFFLCAIQSAILLLGYIGIEKFRDHLMPEEGIIVGAVLIEYYITILLLMYAADTLGIMISCIVKKEETANVMAPYLLIVQLIFSGILFEMKGASEYISYAMISRWGMEGLGSISRLAELPMRVESKLPAEMASSIRDQDMLQQFEATPEHLVKVWLVLLAFSIVAIVVGSILLRRVSKDTRD